MFKRIFMCLLLAWVAIAPAIAGACASECDTMMSASAGDDGTHHSPEQSSTPMDCHDAGKGDHTNDTQTPDGSSMEVACFVAGAVSLPGTFMTAVAIDLDTEHASFILVPSVSFETSPPIKPPQA